MQVKARRDWESIVSMVFTIMKTRKHSTGIRPTEIAETACDLVEHSGFKEQSSARSGQAVLAPSASSAQRSDGDTS